MADEDDLLRKIRDAGVEAPQAPFILVCEHGDRPGMVRAVSEALASHAVNIDSLDLIRERQGTRAMMVLGLKDEAAPDVLSEIEKIPGVYSARLAKT